MSTEATQAAPSLPLIYRALALAMSDVGAIAKTRRNQQQGYNFRGIDDVYNAVQPAFVKHGIVCVPTVLDQKYDERTTKAGGAMLHVILTVQFRYFAADGSYVEAKTLGEAMDSGDKACNKAMSAAQKYAHFQVLSIATEENADTENETHEVAPRQAAQMVHPRVRDVAARAAAPVKPETANGAAEAMAEQPAPASPPADPPKPAAPANAAQKDKATTYIAALEVCETESQRKALIAQIAKEPAVVKDACRDANLAARARIAAKAKKPASAAEPEGGTSEEREQADAGVEV